MAKVFKFVGWLIVLSSIVSPSILMVYSFNPAPVILSAFFGVILGLVLNVVSDLMVRVDQLERDLELRCPKKEEGPPNQVTCTACGKKYDLKEPQCPFCGETKRLVEVNLEEKKEH